MFRCGDTMCWKVIFQCLGFALLAVQVLLTVRDPQRFCLESNCDLKKNPETFWVTQLLIHHWPPKKSPKGRRFSISTCHHIDRRHFLVPKKNRKGSTAGISARALALDVRRLRAKDREKSWRKKGNGHFNASFFGRTWYYHIVCSIWYDIHTYMYVFKLLRFSTVDHINLQHIQNYRYHFWQDAFCRIYHQQLHCAKQKHQANHTYPSLALKRNQSLNLFAISLPIRDLWCWVVCLVTCCGMHPGCPRHRVKWTYFGIPEIPVERQW